MFRASRQVHKWTGIVLGLFLALIAFTGFFLANKKRLAWMQPPPAEAAAIATAAEIVTIERAIESAFALGHPELQTLKDVDRVDYRPKDNIFKVISREGYREVQVDGKTARVLSSSFRNDQFFEDLHDFSFFADWAHLWMLPLVALGLLGLAVTGVIMFGTPVVRRWRFRRKTSR